MALGKFGCARKSAIAAADTGPPGANMEGGLSKSAASLITLALPRYDQFSPCYDQFSPIVRFSQLLSFEFRIVRAARG
jgi:hypothetical protein